MFNSKLYFKEEWEKDEEMIAAREIASYVPSRFSIEVKSTRMRNDRDKYKDEKREGPKKSDAILKNGCYGSASFLGIYEVKVLEERVKRYSGSYDAKCSTLDCEGNTDYEGTIHVAGTLVQTEDNDEVWTLVEIDEEDLENARKYAVIDYLRARSNGTIDPDYAFPNDGSFDQAKLGDKNYVTTHKHKWLENNNHRIMEKCYIRYKPGKLDNEWMCEKDKRNRDNIEMWQIAIRRIKHYNKSHPSLRNTLHNVEPEIEILRKVGDTEAIITLLALVENTLYYSQGCCSCCSFFCGPDSKTRKAIQHCHEAVSGIRQRASQQEAKRLTEIQKTLPEITKIEHVINYLRNLNVFKEQSDGILGIIQGYCFPFLPSFSKSPVTVVGSTSSTSSGIAAEEKENDGIALTVLS